MLGGLGGAKEEKKGGDKRGPVHPGVSLGGVIFWGSCRRRSRRTGQKAPGGESDVGDFIRGRSRGAQKAVPISA